MGTALKVVLLAYRACRVSLEATPPLQAKSFAPGLMAGMLRTDGAEECSFSSSCSLTLPAPKNQASFGFSCSSGGGAEGVEVAA